MKKADRYYSDDITWCVSECETDCPRKPKYIRDKTIPHSFAYFSEACKEYEPKVKQSGKERVDDRYA